METNEQEIKEMAEKIAEKLYDQDEDWGGWKFAEEDVKDRFISKAKELTEIVFASGYRNVNNLTAKEQESTEYKGNATFFDGWRKGYNDGSQAQLAHDKEIG